MLLLSSVIRGGMVVNALGLPAWHLGPYAVDSFPTDLPSFYPYFAYAIGYQLLYQLLGMD